MALQRPTARRNRLFLPGSVPQIDWSHPAASRLVACWIVTGGGPVELTGKVAPGITSSGTGFTIQPSERGSYAAFAANTSNYGLFSTNFSWPGGALSMISCGIRTGSVPATNTHNGLAYVNATTNNSVNAGLFWALGDGVGGSGTQANQMLLLNGAQSTATFNCFINGFKVVSGAFVTAPVVQNNVWYTGGIAAANCTAYTPTWGGVGPTNSWYGITGGCNFTAFFSGKLPDGMMESLTTDPYQILIYPEDRWMALLAGSSSNNFSGSVSESGSAAATDAAIAAFLASDSEAGSASTTQSGLAAFLAGRAETGSAAAIQSAIAAFLSSRAEAGSASTTQAAIAAFLASRAEAGSATNTQSALAAFHSAIAESGSAAATQAAIAAFHSAIAESGSAAATQAAIAAFHSAIAEAGIAVAIQALISASGILSGWFDPELVLSAFFSHEIRVPRTWFDPDEIILALQDSIAVSGAATTTQSGTAIFGVNLTEAGTATDTDTAIAALHAAIAEAGLAAAIQAGIAAFRGTASEAGSAAATQSALAAFLAARIESGAATTSLSGIGVYGVNLTEAGSATDADNALAAYHASRSEAGIASAIQSAGLAFTVTVTELGSAASTQDAHPTFLVSVSETGSAAATQAVHAAFLVTRSEAGAATTSQSALTAFHPSVAETGNASATDNATALYHVSLLEAGIASAIEAGLAAFRSSRSEAGAASSTTAGSAGFRVSRAEAGSATDNEQGVSVFVVSEHGAASTNIAVVAAFLVQIHETGAATVLTDGLVHRSTAAIPLAVAVAVLRNLDLIRGSNKPATAPARHMAAVLNPVNRMMSRASDFTPPIDALVEFETVQFDFGPALNAGARITSATITCAVAANSAGTDPTPAARLSGPPTITTSRTTGAASSAVNQLVGGMIGGVTYVLQCQASVSDGQTLSLWAHLTCQTPS